MLRKCARCGSTMYYEEGQWHCFLCARTDGRDPDPTSRCTDTMNFTSRVRVPHRRHGIVEDWSPNHKED